MDNSCLCIDQSDLIGRARLRAMSAAVSFSFALLGAVIACLTPSTHEGANNADGSIALMAGFGLASSLLEGVLVIRDKQDNCKAASEAGSGQEHAERTQSILNHINFYSLLATTTFLFITCFSGTYSAVKNNATPAQIESAGVLLVIATMTACFNLLANMAAGNMLYLGSASNAIARRMFGNECCYFPRTGYTPIDDGAAATQQRSSVTSV
tara:strand:+ start:155 stop:787 length:633 start_codon:yes stop_codon:yes gene_type:complete